MSEFRYLGHIINNRLTDDDDINCEIRNMFTCKNVLLRRFSKCSVSVKITLFKSYCTGADWPTGIPGNFPVGPLNVYTRKNRCMSSTHLYGGMITPTYFG